MIHLKNKSEIDKMYSAGQIVKDTLYLIEEHIKPGITTFELDEIAAEVMQLVDGKSSIIGIVEIL